jgi:tellurite resistance protein TerC
MEYIDSLIGRDWATNPSLEWTIFFGVIVTLVALDLFVFNSKAKEPSFRTSLGWTLFYVAISILFGAYIWHGQGGDKAMEYYTGYAMELSLSLDNIFVISMIFRAFSVPAQHQHRVLFWGIVGVLLLRGIMIGMGAMLVAKFSFILVFFGAFLIYTGIRMLFFDSDKEDVEENKLLIWMRKHMLITPQFHGRKFFVMQPSPKNPDKKVVWATPLFVTLVLVETADLIFAVDSVPAVFAITTDPYIVYTSNIFAILGLRALYFTLQAMVGRFHYLSQALSLVLMFVGGKIVYEHFTHDKISIEVSLGVVLSLIACGMVISLLHHDKHKGERRS